MDINPPIEKRTTEELIGIIETKDQWRDAVVLLARDELLKRGISLTTQETKRKNRVRYQEKVRSIKSRTTYTKIAKILIVLFGPILAILFHNIFLFQSEEGYKKLNRQGLFYLILGIGLWLLVLYYYL